MIDLITVREEIIDILKNKYESQKLSFLEENHIYFMNDIDGNLRKGKHHTTPSQSVTVVPGMAI